jgi:hypothetical protein
VSGPAPRVAQAASLLAALVAALGAALLVLAACRGGDRADRSGDSAVALPTDSGAPRVDSAHVDSARTDTTHRDSLATRDTTRLLLVAVDSAIGDSLYHNSRGRCITCHGPRGTGNASLGPALRDSVWLDTDGSVAGIASVIHDGVAEPKGGSARMPAFANQLDSTTIHRMAIYVWSLSHPGALARDSAAARAAVSMRADSSLH